MDKETARSLLDLATSMDSTFHKMFAKIDSVSDIDLKFALKTSLGEALKHITVGVVFSIEKQFPELKVD